MDTANIDIFFQTYLRCLKNCDTYVKLFVTRHCFTANYKHLSLQVQNINSKKQIKGVFH